MCPQQRPANYRGEWQFSKGRLASEQMRKAGERLSGNGQSMSWKGTDTECQVAFAFRRQKAFKRQINKSVAILLEWGGSGNRAHCTCFPQLKLLLAEGPGIIKCVEGPQLTITKLT